MAEIIEGEFMSNEVADGVLEMNDAADEANQGILLLVNQLSVKYNRATQYALNQVSFVAKPGKLTAVVGRRGAGKTTLLRTLARQIKPCSGSIDLCAAYPNAIANAVSERPAQKILCLYSDGSDEHLLPNITVYETLKAAADLILPDTSNEVREQRVDWLIRQMRLEKCRNVLAGDTSRKKISTGERRRVTLALALMDSRRSLLFLDEPTLGVDSTQSREIIELLRYVAHHDRRTVVVAIHNPTSGIMGAVDELVLLHRGIRLFAGPVDEAATFFYSVPNAEGSDGAADRIGQTLLCLDRRDASDEAHQDPFFRNKLFTMRWWLGQRKQSHVSGVTLPNQQLIASGDAATSDTSESTHNAGFPKKLSTSEGLSDTSTWVSKFEASETGQTLKAEMDRLLASHILPGAIITPQPPTRPGGCFVTLRRMVNTVYLLVTRFLVNNFRSKYWFAPLIIALVQALLMGTVMFRYKASVPGNDGWVTKPILAPGTVLGSPYGAYLIEGARNETLEDGRVRPMRPEMDLLADGVDGKGSAPLWDLLTYRGPPPNPWWPDPDPAGPYGGSSGATSGALARAKVPSMLPAHGASMRRRLSRSDMISERPRKQVRSLKTNSDEEYGRKNHYLHLVRRIVRCLHDAYQLPKRGYTPGFWTELNSSKNRRLTESKDSWHPLSNQPDEFVLLQKWDSFREPLDFLAKHSVLVSEIRDKLNAAADLVELRHSISEENGDAVQTLEALSHSSGPARRRLVALEDYFRAKEVLQDGIMLVELVDFIWNEGNWGRVVEKCGKPSPEADPSEFYVCLIEFAGGIPKEIVRCHGNIPDLPLGNFWDGPEFPPLPAQTEALAGTGGMPDGATSAIREPPQQDMGTSTVSSTDPDHLSDKELLRQAVTLNDGSPDSFLSSEKENPHFTPALYEDIYDQDIWHWDSSIAKKEWDFFHKISAKLVPGMTIWEAFFAALCPRTLCKIENLDYRDDIYKARDLLKHALRWLEDYKSPNSTLKLSHVENDRSVSADDASKVVQGCKGEFCKRAKESLLNFLKTDSKRFINKIKINIIQRQAPRMIVSFWMSLLMTGGLFAVACVLGFFCFDALISFHLSRTLARTEIAANLYTRTEFFFAKNLVDVVFQILPAFLLACIWGAMMGVSPEYKPFARFALYIIISGLICFAAYGFCYLISVLTPRTEAALVIAPLVLMSWVILAGFILRDNAYIPVSLRWFREISIHRYGWFSLMANRFPPGESLGELPHEFILWIMGCDKHSLKTSLIILGSMGVGYRIIAYFAFLLIK